MNHEQALDLFRRYLTDTCPTCNTPPGQLCDTPAVWIHYERLQKVREKEMNDSLDKHYNTLPEGVRVEGTVTTLRGRRKAPGHPLGSLLGSPVTLSRVGFALAVVAANLAAEGLFYLFTN